MTWPQICEDPRFEDLPYKVETNRLGKIIMSPRSNRHSRLQIVLCLELERQGVLNSSGICH